MKLSEIKTPVSALSGIGPATEKQLASLNVFTVSDLLTFFPRDYKDRTKRIPLALFETAKEVHTICQVLDHQFFGFGKMKTLKIIIQDQTARACLICFNRPFLEKTFPVGSIISVTGSFFIKYNELQSSSFEAEKISDGPGHAMNPDVLSAFDQTVIPGSGVVPVYPLTQGLTQKKISKAIQIAIAQYLKGIDNELPPDVIKNRGLLSKQEAIKKIHAPQTLDQVQEARKTLSYEELFNLQKTVFLRAFHHKGSLPSLETSGVESSASAKIPSKEEMDFSPRQKKLLDSLPFTLTDDQLFVVLQMNRDIDRGYKERSLSADQKSARPPFTMQRLLQGDVGSGKTLTALFAALRVIDWGGQCAFMAPTEILSRQHAENTARLLEPLGVRVSFLSGNVHAAGRSNLLKALKNGDIDILVGTHALFSASTVYKDLQLAVIDEQHRFGVLQRQAIVEKGRALLAANGAKRLYVAPHLLMMSATPIPQTLALTVYGDLDVSTIKTLPKGRKAIKTYLVSQGHEENAYSAVRQEIQKGRQAYFVYPAIGEDSGDGAGQAGHEGGPDFGQEKNVGEDLKSATMAFESLSKKFPQFKCALIHSKVPEEEQAKILYDFRSGKIQILFATTVVEVGVDVPNATCMVIEQADRFGLSQLHQLRGRVGRGSEQSYCFLVYRKNITQNGIERMKILRQTTDGFVIAEQDLKLRGPGEITGTAQSGSLQLGIADLSRDKDLLLLSRADAYKAVQEAVGKNPVY